MTWKQKGLLGLQSLLGSRRSGVSQPSAPGRGPDRKAGYLGYEGFWLIGPNGADEGRLESFTSYKSWNCLEKNLLGRRRRLETKSVRAEKCEKGACFVALPAAVHLIE